MRTNSMKQKLEQGKVVLGVTVQEASIQTIEILGMLGFDYVNIDCLHSPLSVESVARIVMAAELTGLATLLRVPQNIPEIILRYLDVGVMGITVAEMDNAQTAESLVAAVKYEPEGRRSLAAVRASGYGLTESMADYVKSANRETMALGIVESRAAVENIEKILAVPGLDAVIIGRTDLSKAFGVPGQVAHPRVLEAVDTILAAGKKMKKAIGVTLTKVESPKPLIERGFQFVGIHAKSLLISAARNYLEGARAELNQL